MDRLLRPHSLLPLLLPSITTMGVIVGKQPDESVIVEDIEKRHVASVASNGDGGSGEVASVDQKPTINTHKYCT